MMSRTLRSPTSSTPSSMVSASPSISPRSLASRSTASSSARSCGSAARPWVRRFSQRPVVLRSLAIGFRAPVGIGEAEAAQYRDLAALHARAHRARAHDRSRAGAACRARSGAPSARAAASPALPPRRAAPARTPPGPPAACAPGPPCAAGGKDSTLVGAVAAAEARIQLPALRGAHHGHGQGAPAAAAPDRGRRPLGQLAPRGHPGAHAPGELHRDRSAGGARRAPHLAPSRDS